MITFQPLPDSQKTFIRRYTVLVVAILFLVSCGGKEYRTKSSETERTQLFLNAYDVNGRIEGLSVASINSTGILSGSVRKLALMEEREAPIIRTDTLEVTKANPVGWSLATLITLGIYPILHPKKTVTDLVGKEEVTNQQDSLDYSKARRTGQYRWQGIHGDQSETITVSLGHGVEMKHLFVANFNEKSGANFSIDLPNLIKQRLRASNDSEIMVSITCSCLWSGSQADASTDDLKLRPTLNVQITKAEYPSLFKESESPTQDRRSIKPSTIPAQTSQEGKQLLLPAPEVSNAKDIEPAKKKCSELGLKPGTEKFGECVLRLSK